MKWEQIRLGDITDSCLGKMLDQVKNKGEFRPYLANLNVRWGEFDLTDLSQMRFESTEEERYGIKYGDLILCEGGEIGRCAVWKEQLPNMMIQKALHRIRSKDDRLNIFYLFYWFLYNGKRGALEQYASGQTTIKHLPAIKLKEIPVDLPPKSIQDKIVSILSAYDDLIDNCQKQISLLEEAAQRLYKEWFMDFRFPGHESVAIVDGLPDGWRTGIIEDLGKFVRGNNILTTEAIKGSVPVIAGGLTPSCWHNQSNTKSPVITVSGSGANAGYTAIHNIEVWAADCSYIDSSMTNDIYYIYCFLRANSELIRSKQRGAAQPHVYAKDLNATDIIIPTKTLLGEFNDKACNIFNQIGLLRKLIVECSSARDLLLPRLMSGEIEIKI